MCQGWRRRWRHSPVSLHHHSRWDRCARTLDVHSRFTTAISLEYGVTARRGLQAIVPSVKKQGGPSSVDRQRLRRWRRWASILHCRSLATRPAERTGRHHARPVASTLSGELARCPWQRRPDVARPSRRRTARETTALVQTTTQSSECLAAVYGTAGDRVGCCCRLPAARCIPAVDARGWTQPERAVSETWGADRPRRGIDSRPVAAAPIVLPASTLLLGEPALALGRCGR